MRLTPRSWEEITPAFSRGLLKGYFLASLFVLAFGVTLAFSTVAFGGNWRVPILLVCTSVFYIAFTLILGAVAVRNERRFQKLRRANG